MNSPVRTWRMLAAISAGALVLSACGGDSEEDTAATDASAAPSASESSSAQQKTADGTLTLGTLLPQTGSLAFLGPPEFAGVDLAVKEINEAGGVLGKPVAKIDSDSGDTATNIASQSVDRLLSQNVDVIVGAASSGVSMTVIDKITGAGVVQISPANTSPDFTDYPDEGLYFRTAPSDVLQGRILGNQIIEDGSATVGILALQDAYGTGLAENVEKSVTGANGEVVETIIYDPKAAEFTAEVSKLKGADPEAIVVIGFDESAKVIQELAKQGIGPQDGKKLYLVDGNTGNALGEKLPAGLLAGVKGTIPGAAAGAEFQARLKTVDPALKDFSYAAESYDAVNVVALAALAAESDAGADIAENLVDVTTGGEKCSTFADCKQLADAGTDFDYDGVSGPIEFDKNGDPTEASVGVYEYDAKNTIPATAQSYKTGKL
jgi:ABC-type branched-subunit amino acid transport system substrate-binding protein